MISNPSSTEHKFVILRGRTERVTFTVFHTVRDSSVHMDSLAEIVKNCHRDLRAAVKRGEDVGEVWREHVRDEGTLASYSEAMRGLATGPWKGGDATDNRLEQLLFKDLRRQNHSMPTLVDPSLLPASSSVRPVVESFRQQPLRLLDVGSCYNPFLSFPQFLVTAIDIAPASETVTRCDFLNVHIIRNGLESMPNHMRTDTFDVVVFSLLLSYLPSVKQRFLCCVNAHKVLRPHGLLLVITPDSSHQNKHAALMVQWKHCLETIGFHRWKYEKLPHLHCMAFRKTQPTREEYVNSYHDLTIPQDKQ